MKEFKILSVGNSFSEDTMEYVAKIAASLGVKVKLGNLIIGGCSLERHLTCAQNNLPEYLYRTTDGGDWKGVTGYTFAEAVGGEEWDLISFQQASHFSGKAETYDYLKKLIVEAEKLSPNARFVWNMTWAYQQDSTHANFPDYQSDQGTMYEAICKTVQEKIVKNHKIERVSPTGTAIQNARTSKLGDTLTRDGFHLSFALGRYIAGLTFFNALTGVDVEGVSYTPDGVTDAEKRIAVESARNAIACPFAITQSAFPKK